VDRRARLAAVYTAQVDPRDGRGATTEAASPRIVPPELAPGDVIAGRYRLEARLGSGGGGTVWRCRDDQLGATVALKIVAPGADIERWRREVAMARRIADRHVCRVHDLGETPELRFVTMELVEGTSLRDRMRRGILAGEARALFAQVVAGAAAIHAAGIVHRDLKPENVVVAADGRAVIVDFGLAREPGPGGPAVTHTGVVVGTPRYMSPEQAAGEAVDARSDVWALGLIGHELWTGRLPAPVAADADRELGRAIAPRGVAAVIGRCLALDPDARYPDARHLQAALAAAGRRRRAPIALAAVVVAVGSAAVVAAVVAARPGSRGAAPPAPRASDAELFPIVGEPDHWPREAPTSIAVSRDGTRFAYTTAGGELRVQALAPGAASEAWTVPKYQRTPGAYGDSLITLSCAGWFSDGSLALIGTTFRDGHHLFRIERGGGRLLHSQAARFSAAVASDDRVLIGIAGAGVYVLGAGRDPDQILALGPGEIAAAIAVSPDGRQVAVARRAASLDPSLRIQIATPSDRGVREVWRGPSAARADSLLVWLDGARIAFTAREPSGAAVLYTLDTAHPGAPVVRGGGGFGPGSAAGGTVLAVLDREVASVAIGNARAEQLAPVEANVAASRIAGWTTDGHLVFARGEPAQVVRAVPGRGAEPWPGSRAGVDIPDTVAGDSVIAHHREPAPPGEVVVERIDPDGRRTELARLPGDRAADTPVRCAGDRAPPCMLMEITGGDVRWVEIDPATGARGRVLHSRGLGDRGQRDAALSADGKTLAIVEGTPEVIVVDPAAGTARSYPAAGDAALVSAAFGPTGDIWATSEGFRGHRFGVMVFEVRPRTGEYWMAASRGSLYQLALSAPWRPTVSPDGSQIAIAVRERHTRIVRLQGL
jgi:predicted Ser/Thr protein kinase